jgi:phospholipid-translocating ATPase
MSILTSDRHVQAKIYAEPPSLNIHDFTGVLSWGRDEPITVENVLWSGTVLATGEAIGCVIYTGPDTRMVMNTNQPRSKIGLIDIEINTLVKLLFVGLVLLSLLMIILKGFTGPWFRYLLRFFLLFSYMIPISLCVNLELAKLAYSWFIQRDTEILGTLVRSSTIPEELGRIGYILTDKTGTLTQNLMIFKRVHLGTVSYTNENQKEISNLLNQQLKTVATLKQENQQSSASGKTRNVVRKTEAVKVSEAVKAIALCHNVTPVFEQRTSARQNDGFQTDTPITDVSSMHTTDGVNLMELLPSKGTFALILK